MVIHWSAPWRWSGVPHVAFTACLVGNAATHAGRRKLPKGTSRRALGAMPAAWQNKANSRFRSGSFRGSDGTMKNSAQRKCSAA
jgi:hypothetical protein